MLIFFTRHADRSGDIKHDGRFWFKTAVMLFTSPVGTLIVWFDTFFPTTPSNIRHIRTQGYWLMGVTRVFFWISRAGIWNGRGHDNSLFYNGYCTIQRNTELVWEALRRTHVCGLSSIDALYICDRSCTYFKDNWLSIPWAPPHEERSAG